MTRATDIEGDLRRDEIALDAVPEPLRGLIEMTNDAAAKRFRQRGFTIPQWRAITANREFILVADPPHEDKDVCAMMVRALLALKSATSVVFTDEAYTLSIGDGLNPMTAAQLDESKRVARKGLANHPHRKESIIFIAEDLTGHYFSGEREIIRSAKGRAKLGPLRLFVPAKSEGRFVSWLTPEGKPS